MSRLGVLGAAGRKRVIELLGALWRRVPLSDATRARLVRRVPGLDPRSAARYEPPPTFPRPPPRLRAPTTRANGRALGHR